VQACLKCPKGEFQENSGSLYIHLGCSEEKKVGLIDLVPAIFIESENIALVFDAGDGADISMPRGKHLIR